MISGVEWWLGKRLPTQASYAQPPTTPPTHGATIGTHHQVASAEDVAAPAGDEGEKPRTEIARRVDGVSGIEAEGRADQQDQHADDHRRKPGWRRRVAAVGNAENSGDEQRRADDLVDEPAGKGPEKRLRIGRPDAGRALRAEHLADSAVERRQRFVIGHEDDSRRHERTGNLRDRVRQHFVPGEIAPRRQRQSDRRIQVRAGHPRRHVAAHGDREPPRDVDRQERAGGLLAQHDLRDDADAEDDQDERAEELGKHLTRKTLWHGGIV